MPFFLSFFLFCGSSGKQGLCTFAMASSAVFPPHLHVLFTAKQGEKMSVAFAIHAKLLPWHGTTVCVWSTLTLINRAKTTLNILSYGPHLFPFLPLTTFPAKASSGLSTKPAPPNPFPISIPACGSSNPVPLAAVHNFREKSKHMSVILWLISVHLYRDMGWRNKSTFLQALTLYSWQRYWKQRQHMYMTHHLSPLVSMVAVDFAFRGHPRKEIMPRSALGTVWLKN